MWTGTEIPAAVEEKLKAKRPERRGVDAAFPAPLIGVARSPSKRANKVPAVRTLLAAIIHQ